MIVDELMPVLYKDYNISKDPDRHGIGGASSGAIAAFTVAWERPDQFRKVLSIVGSFTNLRGGHVYPDLVRTSEKKPIRVFCRTAATTTAASVADGTYDETRDWFLQNVRLMQALAEKGYDVNYTWGIGRHGQKQGGAILPDMMRWLWRDHPVSTDVNDAVERAFNEPASKAGSAPPAAADPAIAELLQLETPWNDAHLRGDPAALAALWADSFSLTVPGRPAMTKDEALAALKAGPMKFDRYETSDLKVRLYGSSAIVSGRLKRTRTVDGRAADDDWQFTKVYVRPQGKWLVAAFHASSVKE